MSPAIIFDVIRSIANANIRNAKIITRPSAGNGLYLCVLLPILMLKFSLSGNVSWVYQYTMALSLALLAYSVLFATFLFISESAIDDGKYSGIIASGLVGTIIYLWIGTSMKFALTSAILFTLMYSMILRFALITFPRCFTLGEAMMVTQGIVLFFYSSILKIYDAFLIMPVSDEEISGFVVQTGLIMVVILIIQAHWGTVNLQVLVLQNGATIFAFFLFLHLILGQSAIIWVVTFLMDKKRMLLLSSWVVWLVFAIITVQLQATSSNKASTSTRKIFHMLAVAVYLPGLLTDKALMTLASGVALSAVLLTESARNMKNLPVAEFLNTAFKFYSDEKDIPGGYSLTPIYLLCGMSCPLALIPNANSSNDQIKLLSGVISIGIGDAVASVLGSRYGKIHVAGSQRTLEGTLFNIASQFITVCILYWFGYLLVGNVLYHGTIAAIVSAVMEACTDQVDNLILPIITLLTLSLL